MLRKWPSLIGAPDAKRVQMKHSALRSLSRSSTMALSSIHLTPIRQIILSFHSSPTVSLVTILLPSEASTNFPSLPEILLLFMSCPSEFSAVRCMQSCSPPVKTTIADWELESISPTHPHFDPATGVYNVPRDGLYMIKLQIIRLGNDVTVIKRPRASVRYAIRLDNPCPKDGDIESVYLDVGSSSFGQIEHLAKGTAISCERLPDCVQPLRIRHECLRLGVACIQRKRKGTEQPLSKNERKKRRKLMRKEMSVEPVPGAQDSGIDSEWNSGFDSDSSVSEDAVQSSAEPVVSEQPTEETTDEESLDNAFSRQVRSIDALLDVDDETPPYSPMYSPPAHSSPFVFQPTIPQYFPVMQPFAPMLPTPAPQHNYNMNNANNNNNNNQYHRYHETQYHTQYQSQLQSTPAPAMRQSQTEEKISKRRAGRGGASNRKRPSSARKKKKRPK